MPGSVIMNIIYATEIGFNDKMYASNRLCGQ